MLRLGVVKRRLCVYPCMISRNEATRRGLNVVLLCVLIPAVATPTLHAYITLPFSVLSCTSGRRHNVKAVAEY